MEGSCKGNTMPSLRNLNNNKQYSMSELKSTRNECFIRIELNLLSVSHGVLNNRVLCRSFPYFPIISKGPPFIH